MALGYQSAERVQRLKNAVTFSVDSALQMINEIDYHVYLRLTLPQVVVSLPPG